MAVGSILLVDDHELLRQTTTRALHSVGFDVVAKASALEARELLASRRFALIITDVNMPDLQGTALVDELERLSLDTPVVFISGFVDPTKSLPPAVSRRVVFLAKPFLPEQLLATITDCLKVSA